MKKKILCVCVRGMNRSKYLAQYLRRKGYSTRFGGVEPYEKPEYKWTPVSQKKIDWADVIIIVRKRVAPILKKKFNINKKKLIVFDVTDSKRLIPEKFKSLRELNHKEFNRVWTYPQLRKAIKPYLPI
jgi:predicted protein tyrosine phosphatase